VGERKPYKMDLIEPEWAVIKPLIAAWKARHLSVSGRQGRYEMREIVHALRYLDVSEHERRPLRARDPCLAPDLPLMPKHVEGTRAKLNAGSASDSSTRPNPDCSRSPALRPRQPPPTGNPDPGQRQNVR
jgi:hypothetical protein